MTKISKILTIVMIVALVSISACIKQPEKTSSTPKETSIATVGKVAPTSTIGKTPTATVGTTKISEVTVDIKGLTFKPSIIKIARGTKVTWTQSDSISHTVTSTIPGNVLNSPVLSNGQTYSYTFNDDGTFEYICSIHPSMKGTVIVDG